MQIATIIVAAGRGTRAGAGGPKQWREVAGARVIDRSLAAMTPFGRCVLVLHPGDLGRIAPREGLQIVPGGASRSASVRAGLEALADDPPDAVLIHDVARPCTRAQTVRAVLEALEHAPGAAPGIALADALWRGEDGHVAGAIPREGLYRAQTPQGFHFAAILAAHRAHEGEAADDVAVARAAGLDVAIVPGDEDNIKITGPKDFARAAAILSRREEASGMDVRVGNGYDVHAFGEGDAVTLCGITIPHGRALKGHSDADVGMHAITDALYGALGLGDIGRHFPPSDPQWKGADSAVFLAHAAQCAADAGYRIGNIDCTLICEAPKIGPHAAAMQTRLAEILGTAPDRVSVKATTSEKLGFTGREEGIAAMATATLVKP